MTHNPRKPRNEEPPAQPFEVLLLRHPSYPFTVKDAAIYLNVSQAMVVWMAHAKRLPVIRLGPSSTDPLRFRKCDLDMFLALSYEEMSVVEDWWPQ